MGKILHIEDDEDTAEAVKTMLEMIGHSVECTSSGKEGIAKGKKNKYDLILLDIMLHDVSGWEVYEQLKGAAEIAFLSAVGTSKSKIAELKREGVKEFLVKPIAKEELIKRVNGILKKK
jgi:DNA-binding response OmpR family regulator